MTLEVIVKDGIDGKEVHRFSNITDRHFGMTLAELVDGVDDLIAVDKMDAYLTHRYRNYKNKHGVGVPLAAVFFELGIDRQGQRGKNVINWIRAEMDGKKIKDDDLVPTSLVAEMLLWLEKEDRERLQEAEHHDE